MEIYSGFGYWFVCFFTRKRVPGLLEYTPESILLGQAPESHLKPESVVLAISCHGPASVPRGLILWLLCSRVT
jgi:hypothetical protein